MNFRNLQAGEVLIRRQMTGTDSRNPQADENPRTATDFRNSQTVKKSRRNQIIKILKTYYLAVGILIAVALAFLNFAVPLVNNSSEIIKSLDEINRATQWKETVLLNDDIIYISSIFFLIMIVILMHSMYSHGIDSKKFWIIFFIFFITTCLRIALVIYDQEEPMSGNGALTREFKLYKSSIRDELMSYSYKESDYKWFTNIKCVTHGVSCPSGGMAQDVESGVYMIKDDEKNINGFIETIFSNLDSKTKNLLEARLKAITYADDVAWTKDYINTSYEIGDSISGTYYMLYHDKSSVQPDMHRFFIAVVQNTIRAGTNHHFLPEYFQGKEERIKSALMYLVYKNAKEKRFLD